MRSSVDPTLRNLNDCGCCEAMLVQVPVEITNRPGLTAIAYRSGTFSRFKEAMLSRLSSSKNSVLLGLTTRDDDDFTIALLDAWAAVIEVLTFYQERIASESYLRTATERVSLLHLARLIGYELRPGVAATTYLAFTMDEIPGLVNPAISGSRISAGSNLQIQSASGVPRRTTIDIGTKVQSIPAPGEQPQIFETTEKIEARGEWNSIKPRLTIRHPLSGQTKRLFFEGTANNIKPGDGVLFKTDDGENKFGLIVEVALQSGRRCTEVELLFFPKPIRDKGLDVIDASGHIPGMILKRYINRTMSASSLQAEADVNGFDVRDIFNNLIASLLPQPKVLVFRTKASVLGHNAPSFESLPYNMRDIELKYEEIGGVATQKVKNAPYKQYEDFWANKQLDIFLEKYNDEDKGKNNIFLDNVYANIAPNGYLILRDADKWGIYQVNSITDLSKSVFTITAKVSRLTLDSKEKFDQFGIRTTTVFAGSEWLTLARMPIEEPFSPDQPAMIELDGWVDGLFVGQKIVVTGELDGTRGSYATEPAMIDKVEHVLTQEGCTQIALKKPLQNKYVRSTVFINANVASAEHGETVSEILGSGDASKIYQRFALKHSPLTYISAPTQSGAESTLEVRVNDILWHEVSELYGHSQNERIYTIRTDNERETTIQFGDGITGMRLPTGYDNVQATYRKGIGSKGLVKTGQLKLLMTRPLGVKDVINPLDANGAADRESLDDARRNAPLMAMTIDRIISLQDYEDFACAYAGIAKALATWMWDGRKRGIFVTVAGPGGAGVRSDSELYRNLIRSMQKAGDPSVSVRMESYNPALFGLTASVKVDPDYRPEDVLDGVKKALNIHFSFEGRSFGQPVALSEIMAIMQAVQGVVAVDVDELYRKDGKGGDGLQQPLPAAVPQGGVDFKVMAAELLRLDLSILNLKVMP